MPRATVSAGMARYGSRVPVSSGIEERREDAARRSRAAAPPCEALTTGSAAGCRPRGIPGRRPPLPSRPWCAGRISSISSPRPPTRRPRSGWPARRAPPARTTAPRRRPPRETLPANRHRAMVVPMQQNASCAIRPLSCSAMRSKIDDAIGELRVFLRPKRPARQRVHARVFRRFDQGIEEVAADEAGGARDQRDSWSCAHAPKLSKKYCAGGPGIARTAHDCCEAGAAAKLGIRAANGGWSPGRVMRRKDRRISCAVGKDFLLAATQE